MKGILLIVWIASLLFGSSAIAEECSVYGITVAEHTSLYDSSDLDVSGRKTNFIPPSTRLCILEVVEKGSDLFKTIRVTLGSYEGWTSDLNLEGRRIYGKPQDRAAVSHREDSEREEEELEKQDSLIPIPTPSRLRNKPLWMVVTLGILALLYALLLYFLPWVIAKSRKHPQSSTILYTNLIFGWTILGWIAALAWATTAIERGSE